MNIKSIKTFHNCVILIFVLTIKCNMAWRSSWMIKVAAWWYSCFWIIQPFNHYNPMNLFKNLLFQIYWYFLDGWVTYDMIVHKQVYFCYFQTQLFLFKINKLSCFEKMLNTELSTHFLKVTNMFFFRVTLCCLYPNNKHQRNSYQNTSNELF